MIETPYRDVRGRPQKFIIQNQNSARYCSFASGSHVFIKRSAVALVYERFARVALPNGGRDVIYTLFVGRRAGRGPQALALRRINLASRMGAISYRTKGYGIRRNNNSKARKGSAAGWFGKSGRIPVVESGSLRDHAQNVRSHRIWDGNSWMRRSNGRKT